ncbi:AAA family ATPase [Lysinibacillus fusiformis]|uniref:AAA family ATPase n=1 Tax=Lysinibacillus fusiformis TaxID=28031 RepID=UPI00215B35CA|nr:AAA family ATPase [Lysinibacillus fusiformis]MCR8853513.1 AAA family ATPase [Lysinibacillus fusiformis]
MIRVYQKKKPEPFFNAWIEHPNPEDINSNEEFRKNFFNYCNNKCVFCETPLRNNNLVIGFYRPIKGALNTINGQFSKQHYSWLAKEWSNILVLCIECNRAKSNRFPIDGEFCSLYSDNIEINKEKRLLLNPFKDYPERNYFYDEEGMLIPKTKKGKVTIDLLNLNRPSLIDERKGEIIEFNNLCLHFRDSNRDENHLNRLVREINPESPFTGIKRFHLKQMIENDLIPYSSEFHPYIPDPSLILYHNTSFNDLILIKEEYVKKIEIDNSFNVTNQKDLHKYLSRQRYIEYIVIKNFKGLTNLKIDFRSSRSIGAPWLMILGENGVGKSSILQAISIALMGDIKRKDIIRKDASNFLNNKQNSGYVSVKLSGMMDAITIEFDRNSETFKGSNHIDPRILILAYGSTRLLPNKGELDNFTPSWARVENLFDPFQPLVDVESYLAWLKYEDFEKVKIAIENIFFEKVEIIRTGDNKEIKFKFPNSIVKLEDLSDGYKTIIALATDIMMVMKNRWRSYDAEGVVLIDELDAHLHPRWNIEIVKRLRNAFPKIQFIATSHNPLTLRGLLENEIAVLVEDSNNENTVIQDLPEQKGMKIEEILTSKYFGLYDTLPELNDIFQEYYSLLVHPFPNNSQQERIDELEKNLAVYRKLGLTRRDQLFYKAIDIYLAKEKEENKQVDIDSFTQDIENIIDFLQRMFEK